MTSSQFGWGNVPPESNTTAALVAELTSQVATSTAANSSAQQAAANAEASASNASISESNVAGLAQQANTTLKQANDALAAATTDIATASAAVVSSASAASASAASAASAASSATASAESALASQEALAPLMEGISTGTATNAGSLSGAENVPVNRSSGVLQTTLSAIATFVLSIFTIIIASGVGGVARTLLAWMQDRPVSVKDFGAKGDGVTDDTAAIQAAINYASLIGIGSVLLPGVTSGKAYRCTAPLSITQRLQFLGQGVEPFTQSPGSIGGGSWLLFDHPGIGINIAQSPPYTATGVFLDGFGTLRKQPSPGPGFAPGSFDFDIVCQTADVKIGDLMLLNPTKGMLVTVSPTGGGYGRLSIRSLAGQPMTIGLEVDQAYDLPIASQVRWWPFWSDDSNVHAWTKANRVGMKFYRCDGFQCGSYFSIYSNQTIGVYQNTQGTLTKGQFESVYSDGSINGLYIDSSVVGATLQFGNFVGFGAGAGSGSAGISFSGSTQSKVEISNFEGSNQATNCAKITGSGNRLSVGLPRILNWNLDNSGYLGFDCGSGGNVLSLAREPIVEAGGNGAAAVGGSGTYAPAYTLQQTFNGLIVPSSTVGIRGTATNDSVQPGSIGEYVTNSATGVSLTSGQTANVTTLTLTPGDWDVTGVVRFNPSGTTSITSAIAGVSSTSATRSILGTETILQNSFAVGNFVGPVLPTVRLSVATTLTAYCLATATFSGGTCTSDAFFRARRVR